MATGQFGSLVARCGTARIGGGDSTVKICDATTGRCVATLDIGRVSHPLQFDTSLFHRLHTGVGTFDLPPTLPSTVLAIASTDYTPSPALFQRIGYGLNSNGTWIIYEVKIFCGCPRSIDQRHPHPLDLARLWRSAVLRAVSGSLCFRKVTLFRSGVKA
ncbi:hypothetical protein N657DRAFT_373426 [Parathielavia appendiculata]|uniref:Uncharacterized protein n=1 Tax=Parathielavia appendiculata TaxID=2587402 RepID=A0AAN6YYK4_9PEZI|nr:hypothetical protein N657DRAFT_373426 [Parathielavia appendiculata]